MSRSALPPTASTTLAIILGASAWPKTKSPGFEASPAFASAAQGFKNYLLDPHSLGLPSANLFDQFDAATGASDQLEKLGLFLEKRSQELKAGNQTIRDVLIYFVGHGGFADQSVDFYLMTRRTDASSLKATGIAIEALAEVVLKKARWTRRYIFLDCCFAAAAYRSFQGGPDQTAMIKAQKAFHMQAKGIGTPSKGTVLLCSSNQDTPSKILPDESCTIFSRALLDVLWRGDPNRSPMLSCRDIKDLAEMQLSASPELEAPRLALHSPDQSEGDVADIPIFKNLSSPQQSRSGPLQIQFPPKSPSQERRIVLFRDHSTSIPQQPSWPPSRVQQVVQRDMSSTSVSRKRSSVARNILLLVLVTVLITGGILCLISYIPIIPIPIHNIPTRIPSRFPITIVPRDFVTPDPYLSGTTMVVHDFIPGKSKFDETWDTNNQCIKENNQYRVIQSVRGLQRCFASSNYTNFVFEVHMNIVAGRSTRGGIILRADKTKGNFYTYEFGPFGDYGLWRYYPDASGTHSVPLTIDTALGFKVGLNVPNTLAIVANGSTFSLWVNSQKIATVVIPSNSLSTQGQIGVYAYSTDDSTSQILYSNLTIWKI